MLVSRNYAGNSREHDDDRRLRVGDKTQGLPHDETRGDDIEEVEELEEDLLGVRARSPCDNTREDAT